MNKDEKYRLLTEQIRSLIEGERDVVAVMANVAAASMRRWDSFRQGSIG